MQAMIPHPLHARPEWVVLYQRLLDFQVNGYEDVPLAFLHKLGRMNGWNTAYTQRVFDEYKRYLFLTVTAGHFVCPCEAVDQTWHFHLLYTQSYWQDLCGNVLGKPLHHIPSRGGLTEQNAFYRDYAQTLASYERFFGEKPPADIWEKPAERLQATPHLRLVNTRSHWLVPKPRWDRLALFSAVAFSGGAVWADDASSWDGLTMFFIFIILVVVWLIGSSIWYHKRCPVCKTRGVYEGTGIRDTDGKQEHKCRACGHTAWIAPSTSDSGGGGGSGGGCGGGCGGSGGG